MSVSVDVKVNEMVRSARSFFVTAACVVLAGVVLLLIHLFAKTTHRGFFCDDDTIQYPYMPETVTAVTVFAACLILPIVIIVPVELFHVSKTNSSEDSWRVVSSALICRLVELLGAFTFGATLNQIVGEIAKSFIGRLRPFFLEACQLSENVCAKQEHPHVYITEYTCTGDPAIILDARHSFPSGHCALSFYTALYLVIYLRYRLTETSLKMPCHLVQGALVSAAWFVVLSRVHDYRHHPEDAATGMLIGCFWALFTTTCVINMKDRLTPKDEAAAVPSYNPYYEVKNV